MGEEVIQQILSDYDTRTDLYREFAERVEGLLRELLDSAGVKCQFVSSRLKERGKLEGKVQHPDKNYTAFDDITDIAGARVITYLEEDVEVAAAVVKSEFEIDEQNSVDKGKQLDPDRFGYQSQHYVAKLNGARRDLAEWKRYSDCVIEIQIRSVLQHAWAEIEHDLGYKTKQSVPIAERRRFARLAGLLEMVDAEFNCLRADLQAYERMVADTMPDVPEDVGTDLGSLRSLLASHRPLQDLDKAFFAITGLEPLPFDDDYLARLITRLEFVGLSKVEGIVNAVKEHSVCAERLARMWLGPRPQQLHPGVSLFYLCYVVAGSHGEKSLRSYLRKCKLGHDDAKRTKIAADVMKAIKD